MLQPIAKTITLPLLFAVLTCCGALADAQETAATDQEPAQEKPKLKAFLDLRTQIRQKEQLIDFEFGSVPIGFPNLQLQAEKKIAKLEQELLQLRLQTKQSAVDAYLEDPNSNKLVNSQLLTIIKQSLSPTKEWHQFDPSTAAEIAHTVLANGVNTAEMKFLAFRADVALHNFARAEKLLNEIRQTNEVNPEIIQNFEQLQSKWNREFEIRREETANDNLPRIKLETSEGEFIIELFEDHAPQTVANFVSLVESQFFDGQIFHLVVPGKFAQAGCPDGNGRGGPGYQIYSEANLENARHHFSGTVCMSHPEGLEDAGDSKFFILHQPDVGLDGKYTVFGRVIQGMDVVNKLKECDKASLVPDDRESSSIKAATVIRKRDHAYIPTKVGG